MRVGWNRNDLSGMIQQGVNAGKAQVGLVFIWGEGEGGLMIKENEDRCS